MEPRKFLPNGSLLLIKRIPPGTTVQDIVTVFDRAKIYLSPDAVDIRQATHGGWNATISVSHYEVARILQQIFMRGGLLFKSTDEHSWPVELTAFSTKSTTPRPRPVVDNAWPPVVERR